MGGRGDEGRAWQGRGNTANVISQCITNVVTYGRGYQLHSQLQITWVTNIVQECLVYSNGIYSWLWLNASYIGIFFVRLSVTRSWWCPYTSDWAGAISIYLLRLLMSQYKFDISYTMRDKFCFSIWRFQIFNWLFGLNPLLKLYQQNQLYNPGAS